MLHEVDPAEKLHKELGDLSGVELFHNQVQVAVYQRPEKTKSGFILTDQTRGEDRYQSKLGLVVKKGPQAFRADGEWSFPEAVGLDSWVLYRPSDGWSVTVNGVLCRVLVDTSIKGLIAHPDLVW